MHFWQFFHQTQILCRSLLCALISAGFDLPKSSGTLDLPVVLKHGHSGLFGSQKMSSMTGAVSQYEESWHFEALISECGSDM